VASPCGKNKGRNYRRYYRYHRYFKSKIPVYGPSLYSLAIPQAFWKLPDVTHFPSPFYVHAFRSGKRAINNIYRSLGVPQRESVYVTSTLNTFLRCMGTGIGGSSTVHRRLTPLPKEPSRISLMYLIFLETRIIHLHFPADSLCLSSFIFSDERRNFPQDFSISK